MNRIWKVGLALLLVLYGLPSQARDGIKEYEQMQSVLDALYTDMMPNCEELIGLGRVLAGFAALTYISSRIWKHLANAEPIDFYPLFRPFVLGFCIIWFPFVLMIMNEILKPTVEITANMMKKTSSPIKTMLALKEQALKNTEGYEMYIGEDGKGDRDKYAKYAFGVAEGEDLNLFQKLFKPDIAFYYKAALYRAKYSVKLYLSEILMILYQAAALGINAIRTFQMVILAILGPLVFAIAIFDGFQHTLAAWISKYMNVFLWLPICNIFGTILGQLQIKMLQLDLDQMKNATNGETFFSSTDASYCIFLIIGVVGYMSVPTIAGFIVNAGGGGALAGKLGSMISSSTSSAAGMTGMASNAISGGASGAADRLKSMTDSIGKGGKDGKNGSGGKSGSDSGNGGSASSNNNALKAQKFNPSKNK